jgi:hypothetical protein
MRGFMCRMEFNRGPFLPPIHTAVCIMLSRSAGTISCVKQHDVQGRQICSELLMND